MGIPLILSLIHFEGYDEKFEIFLKKSFAGAASFFECLLFYYYLLI